MKALYWTRYAWIFIVVFSPCASARDADTLQQAKNLRFKLCADQGDCLKNGKMSGRISPRRDVDWFRYFNNNGTTNFNPSTNMTDTKGSLLSGRGLRMIVYQARKKGRMKPTKMGHLRRMASAVAKYGGNDDALENVKLGNGRWIYVRTQAGQRTRTGSYRIRIELEKPDVP